MFRIHIIVILTALFFLCACKDTNSGDSPKAPEEERTEKQKPDLSEAKSTDTTIVYAWVDKLRLRAEPDTRGKILDELKEGTALTYLNEKTNETEKVSLRGVIYDEPWLKVKNEAGTEGWVYGGGIKFYRPPIDLSRTPYDKCMALIRAGKYEPAKLCFDRIEKEQLKKDAKFVQAITDGYAFNLLSGEKKEVSNVRAGAVEISDEFPTYHYRYYIPEMGYFVLQLFNQDAAGYLLINDKSGKEIPIWGFPKPSPDHQFLVSTSATPGTGVLPNGIQIYGFTENGFEVVWEKRMTDYQPMLPKWLDENTIELTLLPPSSAVNSLARRAELRKLSAQDWELVLEDDE